GVRTVGGIRRRRRRALCLLQSLRWSGISLRHPVGRGADHGDPGRRRHADRPGRRRRSHRVPGRLHQQLDAALGAGAGSDLRAGYAVRAARPDRPRQRCPPALEREMTALTIDNVSKNFGGVAALSGISLDIESGERRVLLGPNGAGKTTLFHTISGNVVPSAGRIMLFGADITRLRPDRRARLGLARTFQITNLFPRLTVLESVLLALDGASGCGMRLVASPSNARVMDMQAHGLLERWGLAEASSRIVRTLSYGEQRQLEIALALAGKPRLLLLDEPTAGLSPAETRRVVAMVHELPRDMTIIMIEHDMDVAFELADRIAVMHLGRLIAEGDQAAIRSNQQVTDIYLGAE